MLKNKFKIEENGLTIETNWIKSVKPCKKFKFTVGKKSVIVDKEFVYQLLVLMGSDDEIEKLAEIKQEEITTTRRKLSIRAKKDIKEGEMIEVMVDFPVPTSTFEKIKQFSLKSLKIK